MSGKDYHRKCARCSECSTLLDSRTLCGGSDGRLYCNGCHARRFGGASYRGSGTSNWVDGGVGKTEWSDPTLIKVGPGDLSGCKRCQGRVYEMERVTSRLGVWHKSCFSCSGCKTSLNSTLVMAFESPDEEIYCKPCYRDKYGEGKSPLTYTDVSQIKRTDLENGCVRCSGVVYEAEKVRVADKIWFHKNCFSCLKCKGTLDTLKLNIGPGSEVFCKTCYKQLVEEIKPEINTSTDIIKAEDNDRRKCPRCSGKVFEAEKIPTKSHWFHKSCFSCNSCKHKLDSSTFLEGPNEEIYCRTCYSRQFQPSGRNKFGDKSVIRAGEGDKTACINCHNKVFSVDKVLGKVGVYHKHCLSCADCKTVLNPSNFVCGEDGDIYCRNCNLNKGRAGSLVGSVATDSILAGDGDPDMCPRCTGKVFEAEKVNNEFNQINRYTQLKKYCQTQT